MLSSLKSLRATLIRGERPEDHFAYEDVVVDAGPKRYKPRDVRSLRRAMRRSQSDFARILAVSARTIQAWEQGVTAPPPMACRLLESIEAHPDQFDNRVFLPHRRSA